MLQEYDERNKDILVNVNGELLHRNQGAISVFDSVVQGGDAVWEGLRLYQGKIFKLGEHLARLQASAQALAFQDIPDNKRIISELAKTLEANDMHDGVHIRLTLTRGVKVTSGMDPRLNVSGSTLIIAAEHKPPVYGNEGVRLMTSAVRRIPPDCLDQNIHSCNLLNSILAKIQSNAAGADDAVMLDTNGFIAETNATHLFIVYTSTTGYCPEGVTRQTVLEMCVKEDIPVEVGDISLTECYRADEMFCTGTMGELVPVLELDGRPIGNQECGPITRRLQSAYRAVTASTGDKIV
jgi:branched-chain amino acid aminotransferase